MSNTYLQDFGLLRKQINAREVNDPMSSAGRWDDLQLDSRLPHIPQPRRASMSANRKLRIGDLEIAIRKPDAKLTMAFGFVTTGIYKHQMVTPKAITYRSRLRDSHRSKAGAMGESVERYCPHGSVADAIKYYVRKTRFATIQSVADRYRQKIKILWPVRRIK